MYKRFKALISMLRFFWADVYPEDLQTARRAAFIDQIKKYEKKGE